MTFSRPVKLTLAFDDSRLPADITSINVGLYAAGQGWTVLDAPADGLPTQGKVSALITRTGTFAVLAMLPMLPKPSGTSPATAPVPTLPEAIRLGPDGATPPDLGGMSVAPGNPIPEPGEIEITDLEISPARVRTGEPVAISVSVSNPGDHEEQFTLQLKIDGRAEQSRELPLAAGENARGEHKLLIVSKFAYK